MASPRYNPGFEEGSNTPENTRPQTRTVAPGQSAWFGIGIFLFILLLGLIFFFLASANLRHRYLNRQPPPGNPPTSPAPGPVEAH